MDPIVPLLNVIHVNLVKHFSALALAAALLLCATYFFHRQRIILATLLLLFSLASTLLASPLLSWAQSLGVDSFSEAQNFSLNEGIFFIKTLWSLLHFPSTLTIMGLIVIWSLFLLLSIYAVRKYEYYAAVSGIMGVVIILIGGGTFITAFKSNSEIFRELSVTFDRTADASATYSNGIDLFVYVGESTSSMHWGLYGYPRDTTPLLDELAKGPGFLTFRNVLATHTHTAPSLLQALVLVKEDKHVIGNTDTIYATRRSRKSIVAHLGESGVRTSWFSNQSITGTWNQASSLIAEEAIQSRWSVDDRLFPNADIDRPFDEEFFSKVLEDIDLQGRAKSIFLHSYAGHGEYQDHVPTEFRKQLDNSLDDLRPRAIVGDLKVWNPDRAISQIEAYDSAMTYIDHSLASIINSYVITSMRPTVLVYFSDHGESPSTMRGHDSARFVFEMVAIPLIVYFNDTARAQNPALFSQLKEFAEAQHPLSLASVPFLIAEIMGLRSNTLGNQKFTQMTNLLAATPILAVRQTVSGKAAVILDQNLQNQVDINANDPAIDLFRLAHFGPKISEHICYHRANSLIKAIRGFSASGCIEIDIVVEKDGIFIYHPPTRSEGLPLDTVMRVQAGGDRTAIWLDSKNIDEPRACEELLKALRIWRDEGIESTILVEFPSNTDTSNRRILDCAEGLGEANILVSYYVPTEVGLDCLKGEQHRCKELEEQIRDVVASHAFTDLSFDMSLYPIISKIQGADDLVWNAWGFDGNVMPPFKPGTFRMALMDSSADPNSI